MLNLYVKHGRFVFLATTSSLLSYCATRHRLAQDLVSRMVFNLSCLLLSFEPRFDAILQSLVLVR